MRPRIHPVIFAFIGIASLTPLINAGDPYPETPDPFRTALTIQVINEDGAAIGPCDLYLEFHNSEHPKSGGRGIWSDKRKTDVNGKLQVIEETRGIINVSVLKDGYYSSMRRQTWNMRENWKQIQEEQRMIPWNPTMTIKIKEIGDVVPMLYLFDFRKNLPGLNAEYAMDLVEADWLPPHGKGKVTDCFFSVVGDETSSKMVIRFPNSGDGMIFVQPGDGIESQLRFPREAPADAYQNLIEITTVYDSYMRRPSYEEALATGYLFRIRTPKDGQADDSGPLYGKMMNFHNFTGILSRGSERNSRFESVHLYINPIPGDRRIEADMTKNLRPNESLPSFP